MQIKKTGGEQNNFAGSLSSIDEIFIRAKSKQSVKLKNENIGLKVDLH